MSEQLSLPKSITKKESTNDSEDKKQELVRFSQLKLFLDSSSISGSRQNNQIYKNVEKVDPNHTIETLEDGGITFDLHQRVRTLRILIFSLVTMGNLVLYVEVIYLH